MLFDVVVEVLEGDAKPKPRLQAKLRLSRDLLPSISGHPDFSHHDQSVKDIGLDYRDVQ